MEDKELNTKVFASLQTFENIAPIDASESWNQQLMTKITNVKMKPETGQFPVKFATMLTFLVLINVGFVANTINNNIGNKPENKPELARNKDLQKISKILLFSTNN